MSVPDIYQIMLYQSNSFDSVSKINELSERYVYFIVSTIHSIQDNESKPGVCQ